MVNQLEKAGWNSPAQAAQVRRFDGLLTMMSGRPNGHFPQHWGGPGCALAKELMFALRQLD